MTARKADLAELPHWPRYLSREQAASYVGVSPNVFDAEVQAGVWPKAERRGRSESKRPRLTWDRRLLDRAGDVRSGLTPSSTGGSGMGDLDW